MLSAKINEKLLLLLTLYTISKSSLLISPILTDPNDHFSLPSPYLTDVLTQDPACKPAMNNNCMRMHLLMVAMAHKSIQYPS